MPAPARTARSAQYTVMASDARALGENNDCTVKAVAAAAGVPYLTAHAAMAAAGRKNGKGAHFFITTEALRSLGFKAEWVHDQTMLSRYPSPHNNMKNLTTNQPDRFKAAWADGNTYLMRTKGHILCVKNGVNHDWTRGTARRCVGLYKVTPI